MHYLQKNELDRAKEKFTLATQKAPRLPASWYAMGYFLETVGNVQEAELSYQKAIRLDPHDGESHNNYGTFLCRHKRYQEALHEFDLAVKQHSYVTSGAAYENAGFCARVAGINPTAKHYFKKAISNDPGHSSSYFELAKIYFEEKKVKTSYDYFLRYAHRTKTAEEDFYKLMTEPVPQTAPQKKIKLVKLDKKPLSKSAESKPFIIANSDEQPHTPQLPTSDKPESTIPVLPIPTQT